VGGYGSSRWRQQQKAQPVEICPCLDTALFASKGQFKTQGSGGELIWVGFSNENVESARYALETDWGGRYVLALSYIAGPAGKPALVKEAITLMPTQPYFGGRRWWFQCSGCKARVRKLFLPPHASRFRCRWCHQLSYRSCQESHTPWQVFRLFCKAGFFPILKA
jgi:hypothetical protein